VAAARAATHSAAPLRKAATGPVPRPRGKGGQLLLFDV